MTLNELPIGKTAIIRSVGGEGALRQHFLDMGLIPNAAVTMVKAAPMGDPIEVRIHSYELTLRREEAERILIRPGSPASGSRSDLRPLQRCPIAPSGDPLPDDAPLSFALVGNQNSGKTTLFNQLTGASQHVGNFPGVTVERKDGTIRGHSEAIVTDLPGIYSLSPYSSEELVTRRFVLDEHPDGIINIVDATNLERNLGLTIQLMALDVPMVVALNMMDEVRDNGGAIDVREMESLLGVPVVPISAAKNEGVDELVRRALHTAKTRQRPGRRELCGYGEGNDTICRCLSEILRLIEAPAKTAGIPIRFAAGKLAEGDPLVLEQLHLDPLQQAKLDGAIRQMEEAQGMDRAAVMAETRFDLIERICQASTVKPQHSKSHDRSAKIDRILTGRFTAIPAFILIMAAVFWLTFHVIGAGLSSVLELAIDGLCQAVTALMEAGHVNAVLQSLVIDGIFNGVGTVLSFLPIIVTLFFFLSLLEDSGYMARVAFVLDRPLRKLGLSGRSIVPMLVGFGCTVPGVMATRTLASERDRKMTILLTPFMSCSAKLPIYAFFTAAFFPDYSALVIVGLYVLGILIGIAMALLMKHTAFQGEAAPFVMELPNYRMPGAKNVLQLLWEKSKDFLQRAFTVIFLATIVIWFLQTFDPQLHLVTDSQNSILAVVAGWIAPIFKPLGFGDWRISTALITGFMAKESVVSTLSILYGSVEVLTAALSPASAAGLLVFCLLYTPCVAAVTSIRRELGGKWALGVIVGQCIIAWLAAFFLRAICILFGLL